MLGAAAGAHGGRYQTQRKVADLCVLLNLYFPRSAMEVGFAEWRCNVMYVPQRLPALSDTPADYIKRIQSFSHMKKRPALDPVSAAFRLVCMDSQNP